MGSKTDYRKFLHELFDTKPEAAFINIWTLPLKQSHFFTDIDKAADFVGDTIDKKTEIYVMCGFTDANLGPTKRGSKKDIAGLPGFFMDIDFATPGKPQCPPDVAAALSLVEGHGCDPTMVIHTGNGIHCWWLFKECWQFEADEYKQAELLNKRLQATIKDRAAKKKWRLDSTQDSTRVLRIPGTYNHKDKKNPKPVKILKNSGSRYTDPFDFDNWTLAECEIKENKQLDEKQIIKISDNVVIDKTAEPPAEKLDALLDFNEKFRATWAGKREDMADDSPSGYAMSLANTAAAAKWSDQEITNLIVAFYRRHGYDLKKLHPKKIAVTIGNARACASAAIVDDFIENVAPTQGTQMEEVVDPGGKRAKEAVCEALKMDIIRLVQFEQESNSHYLMYLANNTQIPFKSTRELMNYSDFQMRVFEKTRHLIKMSTKTWGVCRQNFSKFMDVVPAGPLTTSARMKIWIETYLADRRIITMQESIIDQEPFIYNNHWYIYGKKFYNWCWQNYGMTQGVTRTDLDLTIINAEQVRFDVKVPEQLGRKKILPWKIPQDIIVPPVENPVIENEEENEN